MNIQDRKGPEVRVIWPSAIDNSAVLKPGRYTVTGRVSGTNFQPKAVVIVKEGIKSTTPVAKLTTFHLS